MNKIVIVFLLSLFIGACTNNPKRIVIEKEKLYIPEFDTESFICPERPRLTEEEINSPNFTEKDVSLFVLELAKRGDVCANKLENIERQIERAREVIKEKTNND